MKTDNERIKFANENWPDKVYRYREVNTYLEQVLREDKLWLSKPSKFNDPCDCMARVTYPDSKLGWLRVFRHVVQHRYSHMDLTKRQLDELALEMYHRGDHSEAVNKNLTEVWDSYGLLCLCLRNDSLPMWWTYGNEHQGVCLEFAVKEPDELFLQMIPVEYAEQVPRPRLDEVLVHNTHTLASLSTKSVDWQHEEEWRVWCQEGAGLYDFNPLMLTGVIMGCRISDEDRDIVTSLVEERLEPTKLYQATPKDNDYGLDILEV